MACLRTVEVALERETPSHLTPQASTPLPFAEGSPDLFQASQPLQHRKRVTAFEHAFVFGTEIATDKNLHFEMSRAYFSLCGKRPSCALSRKNLF